MEETIQNQVSLLIGKYGWLLLVGIVTLLFRGTIEKLVCGLFVFMGNDYNEDDVVEVDGKPGRIVRCGIWSTTFFTYDVREGIIVGCSILVVQNVKINPIDYSDIKVKDLNIKSKDLSILQPVVFEKKIELISIKPIKKNSLRINDKDKVKVNVDNKELLKFNKLELIKNGKNILENVKDDFLFEFRWPVETLSHDKIYKIKRCRS